VKGNITMQRVLAAIVLSSILAAPAFACGGKTGHHSSVPAPAATLEDVLETKPEGDVARARALLREIKQLAAAGKEREARVREAEAMRLLGYRKGYTRCGPGSFIWIKQAVQS
jgi:hypothetical protein